MNKKKTIDRTTIPLEKVMDECERADRLGDGLLFHHRYINRYGELCNNLSPENIMPLTQREWTNLFRYGLIKR